MSIAAPPFPPIYTAPVTLWVEDPITRDYLLELWQDPDIGILIAGGHPTVRAATKSAQEQGLGNVFGLIDRDFGPGNSHQWLNPASGARVFVGSVHEVENYLLDADALAGCALNFHQRTTAQIEARLAADAPLWEWHVAACQVMDVWRQAFQSDFPCHPNRVQVHNQATALQFLHSCPWYTQLPGRTTAATAAGEPGVSLAAAHAVVASWLATGDWRREFPGKELYGNIRGYIYSPPPGAATGVISQNIDVAKSIAEWQRTNGVIPPELMTLRTVIRTKAGI